MAPKSAVTPDTDDLDVKFKRLSIESLLDRHREIFTRALANVLSSPIAEITYAQIIDGLPLSSVALDSYIGPVCPEHPLLDKHGELCPGVLERAQQLRTSFDINVLQMSSRLIYAYQAAAPGSRAFQTRLIELVAIAVHQIAVWLFKLDSNLHKDDDLASWRPSEDLEVFYPDGFPPTFFRHPWYHDYDQYPEGLADGVGYWAEARIFGGVVLFDRREPGSVPSAEVSTQHLRVESDAIYFHSDRYNVTYRIYRLLDGQKQQLIQFLLSDVTPPLSCPLPILGDLNNRQRVDPEEPIETTGIYRDKWERRPPSEDDGDSRLRDVVDTFNYLSYEGWAAAKRRAMKQKRDRYKRETE